MNKIISNLVKSEKPSFKFEILNSEDYTCTIYTKTVKDCQELEEMYMQKYANTITPATDIELIQRTRYQVQIIGTEDSYVDEIIFLEGGSRSRRISSSTQTEEKIDPPNNPSSQEKIDPPNNPSSQEKIDPPNNPSSQKKIDPPNNPSSQKKIDPPNNPSIQNENPNSTGQGRGRGRGVMIPLSGGRGRGSQKIKQV